MPDPDTDERPTELRRDEQAFLLKMGWRAKNGDPILLRRCPETGGLIADPMQDTERP